MKTITAIPQVMMIALPIAKYIARSCKITFVNHIQNLVIVCACVCVIFKLAFISKKNCYFVF